MLFTWPSDGNPMDYGSDRGDAEWAALDFADLLERLRAIVGSERLRVAAHSLGSRTVVDALTVLDRLQTIDVSPLGRYHPTGHEYHRYHPIAEDDFIALLLGSEEAGERANMRRRSRGNARWYELFVPTD